MLKPFYRPLCKTDIRLSPIGLGTVKLGRNTGVKYPQTFRIPDDSEAATLLALARDLGINLIDTAPAYGNSEERLGRLLRGQRKDWFICSKAGETFSDGESRFDFSPAAIRASVERSLTRLQTDYLDAVLLHSDGTDLAVLATGALDELKEMKKEGKIGFTGLSGKTVAGGLAALQASDIAMVTFNLHEQEERPVLDYAAAHHKGIFIKKAFASGHTASPEASLRLVLRTPGTTSAIIGTINPDHLRDNVRLAAAILAEA